MKPRLEIFLVALSSFFILASQSVAGDAAGLYLKYCAQCHGADGIGGSAPALRKEGLLRTVEASYIKKSIENGRQILGMPPFKGVIPETEIAEIASYIKSWQKGATIEAPAHDVTPAETEGGRNIFVLCGGCHGEYGEGAMGPPLLDRGFLASITDLELRRTIMYGRPGTPMKGYLKGMGGLATLTEEEIDQLIAYIRLKEKSIK